MNRMPQLDLKYTFDWQIYHDWKTDIDLFYATCNIHFGVHQNSAKEWNKIT